MISKAERTRQFIIEKAAVLLNTKGMSGTFMSDIMEATKLTKGGIYGNFENKEEICLEVYKYLSGLLSKRLDGIASTDNTAKEKLFSILDYYQEYIVFNKYGGCPILNFGTEADDTNPVIKAMVNKSIQSFQNRLIKIITGGIQNREMRESLDVQAFAIKMFTMIEGGILITRIQNDNTQMKMIVTMLKSEIESFLL